MGAESSIHSSIHSLNSTLDGIEKRIFNIEDIHLHHHSTIASNDSIIISGKKIPCNSEIELVVGPILGLIGTNSARLLIEVNKNCVVSFNIFRADESLTSRRFVRSDLLCAFQDRPIAHTIKNLSPGVAYCIYIGGINNKQCFEHFAQFSTINEDATNVNLTFGQGSRIDNGRPGEEDLWDELDKRMVLNKQSANFLIHGGNLLSISKFVEKSIFLILEFIANDYSGENWLYEYQQLDSCIHKFYREIFQKKRIRNIAKNCCCIFLPGDEESGRVVFEMFIKSIYQSNQLSKDGPIFESDEGDDSVPTNASQQQKQKESVNASKSNYKSRQILIESTSEEQKSSNQLPRKFNSDKFEIQRMALAAVARLLRKYSWIYYRQLWDVNIIKCIDESEEHEIFLTTIMTTKARIRRKRALLSSLKDSNSKRGSSEPKSLMVIQSELDELDRSLLDSFRMASDFLQSCTAIAPICTLELGGGILVALVDLEWCWLNVDGSIVYPLPTNINLNEEHYEVMNNLLEVHERDDSALPSHNNLGIVKAVILVTVANLICEGFDPLQYADGNGNIRDTPLISLSYTDRNKFILSLTEWQRQFESRAVVLVGGSKGSTSLSGYLYDHKYSEDVGDFSSSPNYSVCIQNIVLGTVNHNNRSQFDCLNGIKNMHSLQIVHQRKTYTYESFNYSMFLTTSKDSLDGAFWSVAYISEAEAVSSNRYRSLVEARAFFSAECIYNSVNQPNILVGVVVGKVTQSSANILIELSTAVYICVICIDVVSGFQYKSFKRVKARRPLHVNFEDLKANRCYSISIEYSLSGTPWQLLNKCVGGFTTFPTYKSIAFNNSHRLRANIYGIDSEIMNNPNSDVGSSLHLKFLICGSQVNTGSLAIQQRDSSDFINIKRNNIYFNHEIEELISLPWNGIDLIIHCSPNVDFQPFVTYTIGYLIEAESQLLGSPIELHYIALAKEQMRSAFRYSFGGDKVMQNILRNGSHYFMSSTLLELLSCLQRPTLISLYRELSEYCIAHLVQIISELQFEYQQRLWVNSNVSSRSPHILGDSSVALFELSPNFKSEKFSDAICDDLVSLQQLVSLRQLLQRDDFSMLIILSPIPIIKFDAVHYAYTSRSCEDSGLSYSNNDVIAILDICSEWIERYRHTGSLNKVNIISGSTSISFATEIVARKRKDSEEHQESNVDVKSNSIVSSVDSRNSHQSVDSGIIISQICCSSVYGVEESTIKPNAGILFSKSSENEYSFYHKLSKSEQKGASEPCFAMVDIFPNESVSMTFLTQGDIVSYRHSLGMYSLTKSFPRLCLDEKMVSITKKLLLVVQKFNLKDIVSLEAELTTTDFRVIRDIDNVVEKVLREIEKDCLLSTHKLLVAQEDEFLNPRGHHGTFSRLHSLFLWVQQNFSSSTKKILKCPSTLVFCFLWEIFTVAPGEKRSENELCASLTTHLEIFLDFACVAFKAELALGYLSLQSGLDD